MTQKELIDEIKATNICEPDEHDGSYELVRETIKAYAEVYESIEDVVGLSDFKLIRAMATIQKGEEKVKKNIDNSHLHQLQKDNLNNVVDKVWGNRSKYENSSSNENSVGMISESHRYDSRIKDGDAKKFIDMLVQLYNATPKDEYTLFPIVENKLVEIQGSGIGVAAVSSILHCLEPTIFPIINNLTADNFKTLLGQKIESTSSISKYIAECREISTFRKDHELPDNYRVWDKVLSDSGTSSGSTQKNSAQSSTQNSGGSTVTTNTSKEHELNLILYGPPGTGKTYNSVIHAVAIIEHRDVKDVAQDGYKKVLARFNYYKGVNKIVFTTFHQSYDYEEFIQGIKPDLSSGTIKYKLENGIFKALCDTAKKRAADKKHIDIAMVPVKDDIEVKVVECPDRFVIIIDEINRGNISKIFGELITLIEPKKRLGAPEAMTCKLPYNKENFGVPNNVYIIGTMNTADRSLVQLDTALRRRFAFKEMMPNYDIINFTTKENIEIAKMLRAINERITVLIDREHQIGHSYFTDLTEDSTVAELADIFRDKIIPLLQEYFFDDYEKIKDVLNNNGFIESVTPTYSVKGANNTIYKINETALGIAGKYIEIYDSNQNSTTSANGGSGNNQGNVTSSANGSGGNQSGSASTNGGSDGGEVEEEGKE